MTGFIESVVAEQRAVVAVEHKAGVGDYGEPGWVRVRFADGSSLLGTPEGDCCAYVWVDEVAGRFTPGQVLRGVKQVVYTTQSSAEWEVLDTFVEVITIGADDIAVLCRCSHNGYYGGFLGWRLIAPDEAAR